MSPAMFKSVKHTRISDEIANQIKTLIGEGRLKPGDRLPPERECPFSPSQRQDRTTLWWLQDHLIRTCVREDIADIKPAQQILRQEVHRYNYRQVHSTTQDIPYFRFQRAFGEAVSLSRIQHQTFFPIRKRYLLSQNRSDTRLL